MSSTPIPKWLPLVHHGRWRDPHTVSSSAGSAPQFKLLLWEHGYLSPNITRREAACRDANRTPIPVSLRKNAQAQAFRLERLRFLLNDSKYFVFSEFWRTESHNRSIGGVSGSLHLKALATDFRPWHVARIGRARFDAAAAKVFGNHGRGRYPDGSRHVDSGPKRTWTDQ